MGVESRADEPVAQLVFAYLPRGWGAHPAMDFGPLAAMEAPFAGLAEMKYQFASAEAFTVPIPHSMARFTPLIPWMGAVNTAAFEGRAPGTLLFLGPRSNPTRFPDAELLFIHRAEGWNKIFREGTGRWEEVAVAESGTKLYRSRDFGPLAALKNTA